MTHCRYHAEFFPSCSLCIGAREAATDEAERMGGDDINPGRPRLVRTIPDATGDSRQDVPPGH